MPLVNDLFHMLLRGFRARNPWGRYYLIALEELCDEEHTFILGYEGKPVSMGIVVDYSDEEGGRWGYLYCLTTEEEYRKQGLMNRLYREQIEPTLQSRGYRGVCLVPESDYLLEYYKRWGLELLPRLAEEEMPDLEIQPGEQAKRYLLSAYGVTRIDNPLPYHMAKPFDEADRTKRLRLLSPLD